MNLKRTIWAALTAMALAVTGITPIAALAADEPDTAAEEAVVEVLDAVEDAETVELLDTDAWDGTSVDTSWYDNDTSATSFAISDAADLAGLAQLVNSGKTDFDKTTIYLNTDIDLAGYQWTPIGNKDYYFRGDFDGQSHTISNLYSINSTGGTTSTWEFDTYYIGLFGNTIKSQVASPTGIKNFTINNVEISGAYGVGAVCGHPFTTSYSNIDVTGTIKVTGRAYVGGAFGANVYGNITDVDIIGDTGSFVKCVEDETGDNDSTMTGGLLAYRGEGYSTVSDCDVAIDVQGSYKHAGGVVGLLQYGATVTNCTYTGTVTLINATETDGGEYTVGAIAGTVLPSESVITITDCSVTDTTVKITESSDESEAEEADVEVVGGYYNTDVSTKAAFTYSATVDGEEVTGSNYAVILTSGTKSTGYSSLADAISDAVAGDTVTIYSDGTYDPFTVDKAITIEAADGVEATVSINSSNAQWQTTNNSTGVTYYSGLGISAEGVTIKNIDFVAADGTSIVYYQSNSNNLTFEDCSFVYNGTETETTAFYHHQLDVTFTGCTFENWKSAYYCCGDSNAPGVITFTGNTFKNVKVAIDGYWGAAATDENKIIITGNTFTTGETYTTMYLQLWDYVQYLYYIGGENGDFSGTAINATVQDNIYNGNVKLLCTHFNWYGTTNLTTDTATDEIIEYRQLVEVDIEDGVSYSSITAVASSGQSIDFEDHTTMSKRSGKTVFYSLPAGDYTIYITTTDGETTTTSIATDSDGNIIGFTVEDNDTYTAGEEITTVTLSSTDTKIEYVNQSTVYTLDESKTTSDGSYISATEAVQNAISVSAENVTKITQRDDLKYSSETDEDGNITLTYEIEPYITINSGSEEKLETSGTAATVTIPVDGYFDDGTDVMIKHEYDSGVEYFFTTVADGVVSVTTYKGFSTWTISAMGDVADEINIEFEQVTTGTGTDIKAVPGQYYIKLVGVDATTLYRFSTAQLAFKFEDTNNAGETCDITKIGALSVVSATEDYSSYISITDEGDGVYLFNLNGSTDGSGNEISDITGDEIILGIAKISGVGTFKLVVDEDYENQVETAVYTVNYDNNIVRTYSTDGDVSNGDTEGKLNINEDVNNNDGSGYIDDSVDLEMTTLTVNVMFPNAVETQGMEYNSMSVAYSNVTDSDTVALGDDHSGDDYEDMAIAEITSDINTDNWTGYSFNISVPTDYETELTFTGDGYRTYRTSIVPTASEASVTVWNNVMDDATTIVTVNDDDVKTAQTTFLAGEIVANGVIDLYDLSAVVSYFGKTGLDEYDGTSVTFSDISKYITYDLNRDGKIDSKDIAMVLVSWGN